MQKQKDQMTYDEYLAEKEREKKMGTPMPIEDLEAKYNSPQEKIKRGLTTAGQTAQNIGTSVYEGLKQVAQTPEAQAIKNAVLNAGRKQAMGQTPAFAMQKPPEQEEPEGEMDENEKTIPEYTSALGILGDQRDYVSPIEGLAVNKEADNSLEGFSGFSGVRQAQGFQDGSPVQHIVPFQGGLTFDKVGMEEEEPSGVLERVGRNIYGKKDGKKELTPNAHVNVEQNEE